MKKLLTILLFLPFAAKSQVMTADTVYAVNTWTDTLSVVHVDTIKYITYRNLATTPFIPKKDTAALAVTKWKLDSTAAALATFTQSRINDTAAAIRAAKQNTISMTTTGSGAATWNGTNMNIPTPAGGGLPGYTSVKRIADTTLLLTTLANVGDMKFTVTAGTYYHFRYVLIYSSPALTTGIRVSLTYPAVTISAASVTIHGLAADGAASEFSGTINSSGDVVVSTAVAAINVNYTAVIEGTILPSATGVLTLQFGSEVAASGVVLRRGSMGYLWTY